ASTRTPIHPLPLHDALPISLTSTAVRAAQTTSADHFTAAAVTLLAWAGFGAVGVGLSVALSNASRVNQSHRNSILALAPVALSRSEEHTSELQSRFDLVCRL